MTFNLVKGLSANENFRIIVVVLNEGQVAEAMRIEGIDVYVLNERQSSLPSLLSSIRKILHEFQPSIIHSHRYKENVLACLASFTKRDVYLIATQHGMPETYGKQVTFKNRGIRWLNALLLSRRFDCLVVVSREMKDLFVEDGFDQQKLVVIHNGIELPQGKLRVGSGESFVIGSCGRLVPVKNYGLFVEIATKVVALVSNARFELAGDGPQLESLRYQCHKNQLGGRFYILGHVENMQSFYKRLDIFVNTSLHEGLPMSTLEAMGHGVPVVAPAVGGFPEIIDHMVDGILIAGHEPEAFVQACLELRADPELFLRMSKAAHQKIETKFTVNRMIESYARLYKQVVTSP